MYRPGQDNDGRRYSAYGRSEEEEDEIERRYSNPMAGQDQGMRPIPIPDITDHGHDNGRYSNASMAAQVPARHTPMPVPNPPTFQHRVYAPSDYPDDGYNDPPYEGDLSRPPSYLSRQSSHEDQYQHASYHEEPYQTTPQDIPLLPQPSRSSLYNPTYDPFNSSNARLTSPYDPSDDALTFLRHHPSLDHFQRRASSPSAGSAPAQTAPGATMYSAEQRIDGELYNGNLVRDCPVPPKLLRQYPRPSHAGRDEFTHMRYTAATCNPADFVSGRYELRQMLFAKKRRTELMIVITMYNEDDLLFARTLAGVFENIEYMCNGNGKSKKGGSFGKEGWKSIVVVVVSDGRAQLDDRTKAVMAGLGVYQDGIGTEALNSTPVTCHIYEYTTQVGITVNKKTDIVETRPGTTIPVQMIFCLKEQNKGKLNSHRWALSAIGEGLGGPNIVVLLDAGTRPGPQSVYQLYRAFQLDPNCGGACGEIKAMLGRGSRLALTNPVVACQNFEYKMSNLLDKPMESAFGFISVLPGAFSAYRYLALQNNKDGTGPLEKYFAGEAKHSGAGIFTRNMYLAEDRILCFELVAKQNASWVLTYVKSATGETDVPELMVNLIKQRRRWLNGSFFAAVYAQTHFFQLFGSSHSPMRKCMFMVEFLFQAINMLFAWFGIGNFFLVFQILTTSLAAADMLGKTGEVLSVILEWIYLGTLVTCFVLALGNKPEGSKYFYNATVWFFSGLMLYLAFACVLIPIKSVSAALKEKKFTFQELFSNSVFFTLIVSLMSTYILWIFISVISLDAWHIVTSSLQYFLLSPTYVNTINIYAFCNVHDVSWGTRDDSSKPALGTTTLSAGSPNLDIEVSADSLDAQYDMSLSAFVTKAPPEKPKIPSEKEKSAFQDASFRSYVVLGWMFCNAALVAIITGSGGVRRLTVQAVLVEGQATAVVTVYLKVVLWSVAALSGFKFVGAMWYLIRRMFLR